MDSTDQQNLMVKINITRKLNKNHKAVTEFDLLVLGQEAVFFIFMGKRFSLQSEGSLCPSGMRFVLILPKRDLLKQRVILTCSI